MRAWLMMAVLVPGIARAQDGMDGHAWQAAVPIGDGRDAMLFPRPGRFQAMKPAFAGIFEYAKDPVVVLTRVGDGDTNTNQALANVVALNLAAGFAFHERIRLDVSAPIYLTSSGLANTPTNTDPAPAAVSNGFGIGDIRVGALANILIPGDEGGVGLGVVPYLDLPTGSSAKFLGAGGIAGGAKVVGTVEAGPLVINAGVGPRFAPHVEMSNLTGGAALDWGLGAGFVTSAIGIHTELRMATPFAKAIDNPWTGSPGELLLYGRWHAASGANAVLGASFGVTPGFGASTFRVFLGGGLGNPAESGPKVVKVGKNVDTDMDGMMDAEDQCPQKKETKNGYKDDDGCPDKLASTQVTVLKDDKVTAEIDVTLTGPSGTKTVTSDYVPAVVELLPGIYKVEAKVPGYEAVSDVELFEGQNAVVADLFPTTPAKLAITAVDTKGKPVPNAKLTFRGTRATDEEWSFKPDGTLSLDAKAGKLSMFVMAPGLSSWREDVNLEPGKSYTYKATLGGEQLRITQTKLEILQTVYFDTNKATIKSESFPLLDEVANTIATDRTLVKIEVAGHTDNVGEADFNQKLSQDRAQAVVDYLVKRGIDKRKLEAVGYGATKPIAKNNSEDGKAKNRRVEFIIKERRANAPSSGK